MATPARLWRWHCVIPVLVIISGIVNLRNPHLTPGSRATWMFVLLPLAVIMLGDILYMRYRGSRSPHDASNGQKPETDR
jgi:hypothetical protein